MLLEEYFNYKLEHFSIEKSEEEYGPVWVITPIAGPLVSTNSSWQKVFTLRSDYKMDKVAWMGEKPQSGVHLDTAFADAPLKYHGWKGVYRTDSMDKAVEWLITDINDNHKSEIITDAMGDPQDNLRMALDNLDDAATEFSRQDLTETVEKIKDAYQALMFAYVSTLEKTEKL